jgi:WhiB family transcriptional regulator, redox-sensing transcriptional regulator
MTATDYVTDWRALGACLSADPDLFFPISATGPALAQIAQAKAVCAGCQVRQECLEFALQTHQIHGVWGGTSAEERASLRRRAPVRAGSSAGSRPLGKRPATPVSSSRPRR